MSELRALGQDVQVMIIKDKTPMTTITAVHSFEASFKFERKEEGYLGETSQRYDEVYKGVEGKLDFHLEGPAAVLLMTAVRDRARSRRGGTKINIKVTVNFPSGDVTRLMLSDVRFADMPISFGGRLEYGVFSMPFACEDIRPI